jgi:uncharacterized membrane protein YvlD (DUF360 family)
MNDQHNNDKDPNKLSEEELLALLEELKKKKKPRGVSVSLGFLLHKNYIVHMSLSLIVNFLIAAVVIGLAIGLGSPIISFTVVGFILAFMLLTVIENFIKILMFKYVARAMILSMGLLSVIVQMMILYIIDLLLPEGFHFITIEGLIIFSFVFSLFRLVISTYLRRWIYKEHIIFFGGKS